MVLESGTRLVVSMSIVLYTDTARQSLCRIDAHWGNYVETGVHVVPVLKLLGPSIGDDDPRT